MDPYRLAGFRCPVCPEAPLREFQKRLCCDECSGLFMELDDLKSACEDLDGRPMTITFSDDKPTEKACPRCERTLVESEILIQPTKTKKRLLRCTDHGVWCTNKTLTGILARMRRGIVGANSSGGGLSMAVPAGTETRGLDGLPIRQFGASATAGLAISNWRARPRKRERTLSPVNAYADVRMQCPTCSDCELVFMADRYLCGHCSGTFVQNGALESLIADMAGEPFDMPVPTGSPGTRLCPVCSKAMIVEALEGVSKASPGSSGPRSDAEGRREVSIDRCEQHGVWFDPSELTRTLEQASGQFDTGVRAWLKRLFT